MFWNEEFLRKVGFIEQLLFVIVCDQRIIWTSEPDCHVVSWLSRSHCYADWFLQSDWQMGWIPPAEWQPETPVSSSEQKYLSLSSD